MRYYYESGALQIEGEMRDGKKEGMWTYRNPDGTIDPVWTGEYRADQKVR